MAKGNWWDALVAGKTRFFLFARLHGTKIVGIIIFCLQEAALCDADHYLWQQRVISLLLYAMCNFFYDIHFQY